MTAEEEETPDRSVIIRGIILVYDYLAQTLIDTGATHSFISSTLACTLKLDVDTFTIPLRVTTPVWNNVMLNRVCRSCSLTIAGYEHTRDLILLDMTEFDVILGMDWLYGCE